MKSIVAIIILLLSFQLNAQDYRDTIVGKYDCRIRRYEHYPPDQYSTIWYDGNIYVTKDTFITNKVILFDSTLCHDPVIIGIPCNYNEILDSIYNFNGELYCFKSHGVFLINNDSLLLENNAKGVFAGYGGIYYSYFCHLSPIVNITKLYVIKRVRIFPCPAKDIVFFSLPESIIIRKVEVYNLIGQVQSIYAEKNKIGIVNLEKGMYILKITTSDNIQISGYFIKI
jgi:Secretion system C-terminal sorting domain